ncbi:MAG: alpha/beta fold hydrolase [Cyanobacteriota bacterium]
MRAGAPASENAVVLIHGFGASSGHWRHTIPALAANADVVAVDLLGFGASDKPRSWVSGDQDDSGAVHYCFDLWADQVVDLLQVCGLLDPPSLGTPGRRLHLVGNSIGGMVALAAACRLRQRGSSPYQVVLINCAQRTLDDRRLVEQPALNRWIRPLLKQLIRQRGVTSTLFRLLARPVVIRQVLQQAYPSGSHVDEQLISLLHRPSLDPGASESFRGFVNLFRDHLAPDLLEQLSRPEPTPVRMIWGMADPWENHLEARSWLQKHDCIQALIELPQLGHCPHDEAPEQVNPILCDWIFGSSDHDSPTERRATGADGSTEPAQSANHRTCETTNEIGKSSNLPALGT